MNTARGVMAMRGQLKRTGIRPAGESARRTSITTASWVIRDPAASPKSTMWVISWGGRLSATYLQPRSSSTLAAVPRPAPDSLVTKTTSIPLPSGTILDAPSMVQYRGPDESGRVSWTPRPATLIPGTAVISSTVAS